MFRKARTDQEEIAASTRDDDAARAELAFTTQRLGIVLNEMGRLEEAETEFRTTLATNELLAKRSPQNSEFRRTLARFTPISADS